MSELNQAVSSTRQATKPATRKRQAFELEVVNIEQCSKNIKRFIFADPAGVLKREDESGYIKCEFQDEEGKTRKRSYTVREVDEAKNEVVVDFVCHGVIGPASAWASVAKVGDKLQANGPGPAKLVDPAKDWFFIVGDMASLPAIAVNLKLLSNSAKGYALIEVEDESDIQDLDAPEGILIEWVVNGDHAASPSLMKAKVESKSWLDGQPYVWVASEFETSRALRQYFKVERALSTDIYVSSYWKLGDTDEGNKLAKKEDGGF